MTKRQRLQPVNVFENEKPQPEGRATRTGVFARAVLLLIRVYQVFFSPLNISSCRYQPTCSHYTYEAVERYGARRGAWLGLRRILRCHPFSASGFDPVPDLEPASHEEHSHGGLSPEDHLRNHSRGHRWQRLVS